MEYKYIFNLFIILIAIRETTNLCIGTSHSDSVCLSDLNDEDAEEKLQYIMDKYGEVEMKITGTPIDIHGKRISYGSRLEYNIGFRYIDNTENDIIQYCEFVLLFAPNECETINLYCNTFLPRTPRPLLERETLNICEDDVAMGNGNGNDQDGTNNENDGTQET